MVVTQKKLSKLEGIGLILILLSFFVQMVEVGIESDIREHENYQIHKKLDHIWAVASHDYALKHGIQESQFSIDFQYYLKDYEIYSENKQDLDSWQKLVKYDWFINVRLVLFVIGSALLLIVKFL
jgi:hypothetical protein